MNSDTNQVKLDTESDSTSKDTLEVGLTLADKCETTTTDHKEQQQDDD